MNANLTCPRCGRARRYAAYSLCWKCDNDDKLEAAYARGYAAGRRDALASQRGTAPMLDDRRIRQLLQLAHPDKHNGSAAANDATAWLLEQRNHLTWERSA